MMNKKEKYIEYIVDDLMNNTEIDYEREKTNLLFRFSSFLFSPLPTLASPLLHHSSPAQIFYKYLKEMYGTREEEVEIIWDLYRNRIKSLIKK